MYAFNAQAQYCCFSAEFRLRLFLFIVLAGLQIVVFYPSTSFYRFCWPVLLEKGQKLPNFARLNFKISSFENTKRFYCILFSINTQKYVSKRFAASGIFLNKRGN